MRTPPITCRCNLCSSEIEFEPNRAGETITCPWCAQDTELYIPGALAKAPPSLPRPIQKNETDSIVFQDADLLVTRNRMVIRGHTIAVRNITTVSPETLPAENSLIIILALTCVVFSAGFYTQGASSPESWVGVIVCALLALAFGYGATRMKPAYRVLIRTSANESFSYRSTRAEDAELVLHALNEAIARL